MPPPQKKVLLIKLLKSSFKVFLPHTVLDLEVGVVSEGYKMVSEGYKMFHKIGSIFPQWFYIGSNKEKCKNWKIMKIISPKLLLLKLLVMHPIYYNSYLNEERKCNRWWRRKVLHFLLKFNALIPLRYLRIYNIIHKETWHVTSSKKLT